MQVVERSRLRDRATTRPNPSMMTGVAEHATKACADAPREKGEVGTVWVDKLQAIRPLFLAHAEFSVAS